MLRVKSEALGACYRTCLEGQDHQQRSQLHTAVLDALPSPSSAIDSLPLFEVRQVHWILLIDTISLGSAPLARQKSSEL